jgi:FAD:protein FMN transferase
MLTRSLCNPRSTEPVPDVSLDAWPRRKDVRTGSQRQVRVEQIMGTAIGLDLREPWVAGSTVHEFFDWLHSVDARFSTYRDDSLVSRLRRGEIAAEETDEDFRDVLAMCAAVERLSRGAFDIWHHSPDGIDPSGLVKGWSIDRGARLLRAAGARNFCINAGGDVLACGEAAPGRPWKIGIRHPQIPDKVAVVVAGHDLAVATSGAYERGHHIVDPSGGRAPLSLLSTTISGPSLAYADAYATAAFAMGDSGLEWMNQLPGYAGLAITAQLRVVWSEAFDQLVAR